MQLYRRHAKTCSEFRRGQNSTMCNCPIWGYAVVGRRKIRQSLGTKDISEARERSKLLTAGQSFSLPAKAAEDCAPPVPFATQQFLASCKDRNLKGSTLYSYNGTLAPLAAHFPKTPVSAVTVPLMDEYRRSRKIAPGTWRKELETLRAFFTWCQDRNWTLTNPARKMKMPRVEGLTTLPFSTEEVSALLAASTQIASDDPAATSIVRGRARALVYVLLYSGLRISDVARLRVDAINMRTGHLTLRVLKTGVSQKLLLHPDALAAIGAMTPSSPTYLFWTGNGSVVTCVSNLRRTIQRLGVIAGIHAHPHRFRDTFAVELLTKGADIRTVQQLLGHRSVQTSEKHYCHFIQAHQVLLDSATAKLDFGD